MKVKEIRDLSTPELHTKLNEAYQEMFKMRLQLYTRQLINYRRLAEVRRNIARIKTVMRERQLREAS